MMNPRITRRSVLRGAGAAVLLPLAEPLLGATNGKPPARMVFLNFGFGPSEAWYPDPAQTGKGFALPEAMKPLSRHRESFSVLGNLTNVAASGTGAHWGATTFLTGADVRRTPGREFHNSISCDQVAAQHLGKDVRYPSLPLTGPTKDVTGAGPGTSLSWDEQGNPIQGISDAVALFSLLFGDGGMAIEQRRHLLDRKRSILDAVQSDAKAVDRVVGPRDREKVGEYFGLIRDIEKRLARDESWMGRPKPAAPFKAPAASPVGTPGIELMFDLITAALRTDSTRVVTYRLPTNSLLKEFGEENNVSPVGAHPMTHFGTKTSLAYKQLTWRDRKVCDLFATLLDKMKAVREPDGSTLLDNTFVVMGSGLRTGHKRRNLPILLGGGMRLGAKHGRHHVYEADKTPLANLWMALLGRAGCPVESFADSNGVLSEVFA